MNDKVTLALLFSASWQIVVQGVASGSLFLLTFYPEQALIVGPYFGCLFFNDGTMTLVFSMVFISRFRQGAVTLLNRAGLPLNPMATAVHTIGTSIKLKAAMLIKSSVS